MCVCVCVCVCETYERVYCAVSQGKKLPANISPDAEDGDVSDDSSGEEEEEEEEEPQMNGQVNGRITR